MGNTHVKPHPRNRNKKQVHWKAADRPSPPGKPELVVNGDSTPDLITFRWNKPTNDGGSPITGYLVEHRRTGSPHWVRATPLLVPIPELTIGGLEPGWRYQFRVAAENAVGFSDHSELSEPVTVTLQRSAVTAPRFLQELEDTTALENEKSEFIVYFVGQPPPKVSWFKDGFEIFSSRRIRITTEHDKSVLTIHQSALSDEGEIKCTATNRAGHASTKAQLTLEAPPSIRLPRQYEDGLLFEIGEMIRLKVSVAGRPTPLVFWSHNGESTQNNERYDIEDGDKSSILKIAEAKRHDRGEYQIKAINKLGEDVTSFLVTVTDKPSPPGKARVVMTLGRSVTLSWSTPDDDGGCKIGNYIIEYYRLGWDMWLKAATTRQLTTILGDLIEGSEYKFRVKAESPYGVSEPSEESDTIFIPDKKRGILNVERARSQPRDIIFDQIPIAAKRKNKRSQSSTRAESSPTEYNISSSISNAGVPKRPDRNKIKSPPKTPELSAVSNRKEIDASVINKAIFDRASMARELAYGSPEIKVKKELDFLSSRSNTSYSTGSERSKSPSPISDNARMNDIAETNKKVQIEEQSKQLPINPEVPTNKNSSIEKLTSSRGEWDLSVSPERKLSIDDKNNSLNSYEKDNKTPSPRPLEKHKRFRENESFTGSSEFMLVLYSDENSRTHGNTSEGIFDFDENSVPPPISLSAPELCTEPPQLFFNLKPSASSTELLHERAMIRLYEAAEAEEAELERKRKANEARKLSVDIPKIQINSQDNQDIVGLERRYSLRRRYSAGGITQEQALRVQRRQSFKQSKELSLSQEKKDSSVILEDKRELMMQRQRSESEEKEEEEFNKIRERMTLQNQGSFEKRRITVADVDEWNEDYEESLSEEETESSSEDERYTMQNKMPVTNLYQDDEEETYHPSNLRNLEKKDIDKEPFEILTVKKNLPDPNFIPKPILKKTDYEETLAEIPKEEELKIEKHKTRSHSPIPQSLKSRSIIDHSPSSLSKPINKIDEIVSNQPSSSLFKENQLNVEKSQSPPRIQSSLFTISSVAQITGITAASIVIPEKLLEKQKDAEEAKVVIDHYGDIVRSYGSKKKSLPHLYLNREELKMAAENNDNVEEKTDTNTDQQFKINNTSTESRPIERIEPTVKRKESLSEEKLEQPLMDTKTKYFDTTRRESITKSKEKPSRFNRSKRTPSQSPGRRPSSRSSSTTRRQPSKSPTRPENWSAVKYEKTKRHASKSPVSRDLGRRKSKSPSPIPPAKSRPMLREIMTQTSIGFVSRANNTPEDNKRQEQLLATAEVKVRSVFDYLTDLAMFGVACWLYLFNNELLAIPILFIMVYRQLKDEVAKRIPSWILRRIKRKKQ